LSVVQNWYKLRETVVRPVMEKLKNEYEAQGHESSIGTEKPPDVSSKAIRSQRELSATRRTFGAISLRRNHHVVSIFLTDSGDVVLKKLKAVHSQSFKLNEISPDLIEESIREAFK
jgi:hypothetical protein